MAVYRSELLADDIVEVRGLQITTPVRTAFDIARRGNVDDAIVTIDALLNLRRAFIASITAYAGGRRRSWPGARQAAEVLAQIAEGAESPMETRLRLVLTRAGLPMPTLQHRVFDERGCPVARLDLAYVQHRFGIEYDGEYHFDARAARMDLRRQNMLRALGWSLFRFTAEDVLQHPGRVVAQVRAALSGTLWLPVPA